jgi:hypothetical protein
MAITAASVSVGTTAVLLSAGEGDAQVGSSVAVAVPSGGSTVYLGDNTVTSAAGFPLAAGSSFSVDLNQGESLYGVTASGTQAVNVLRQGV